MPTILSFHETVVISLCVTAAITSPGRSQTPDTVAVIRTPTLIALAADTAGPVPATARAVADSLGFTLVVRKPPLRQIIDQAHAAVYYVPRDWLMGYLIIVPGRRPDVVRGLVASDSLRVRILTYLRLHRQLHPGSD